MEGILSEEAGGDAISTDNIAVAASSESTGGGNASAAPEGVGGSNGPSSASPLPPPRLAAEMLSTDEGKRLYWDR